MEDLEDLLEGCRNDMSGQYTTRRVVREQTFAKAGINRLVYA
jgi:hypothetical protein